MTRYTVSFQISTTSYPNAVQTTGPAAIMRILHYPPQDPVNTDDRKIGIGAHTE